MIPGDLAEEDGWYWPNYRIACGDKKFTVTKVEPIVLPGRREIVWLDYKQREITLEGDRRVVTPERIVFRAPRLTLNDVDAIEARYERLRNRGEQRDTQEVETLLGQVFLWALQDSGRGVAALKNFRETFRPDGAYGEAEATYREMYRAITGRPL